MSQIADLVLENYACWQCLVRAHNFLADRSTALNGRFQHFSRMFAKPKPCVLLLTGLTTDISSFFPAHSLSFVCFAYLSIFCQRSEVKQLKRRSYRIIKPLIHCLQLLRVGALQVVNCSGVFLLTEPSEWVALVIRTHL